jgi:outer membrane protein assembly factor BamB
MVMRNRLKIGFGIAIAVLGTVTAMGQNPSTSGAKRFDWPQWRGPNRDGKSQETGLLASWPKDGPPLAWTTKNLGMGYSSVAVAAGRIYTMGGRGGDDSVIALEENSGKEIWRTRVGDYFRQNMGDGPRCTPTIDGDLLYALGGAGDLVCLEAASGKLRWRKSLPKDFGGRMMSGWGWSESPLVDGDKVLCTPGAENAAMVALNKKTGDVIWKASVTNTGGAGYASIVATEAGGIRQYLTLFGRGIVGVAARDGKFLWRYDKIANGTANIPTPIVDGDQVFCSTGYRTGAALLKLTANGGGIKAEQQYFLDSGTLQNHHGGMVLLDGYIYCGHGHNAGSPTCIELKTGRVAWKDRGAGQGSAAVLYADGHLYFRWQNGTMALVEATPSAYKQTGKFQLPNDSGKPSWPHPVIANGRLYVRDQDALMCFDVKQRVAGK